MKAQIQLAENRTSEVIAGNSYARWLSLKRIQGMPSQVKTQGPDIHTFGQIIVRTRLRAFLKKGLSLASPANDYMSNNKIIINNP